VSTFSITRLFFRVTLCFSLAVVFSIFIGYRAEAAEAGNDLFNALRASLNLTVSKDAGQTKEVKRVDPQRVYSAELISTPHVRVSLSDTMKLFLNLRPIMKDYYYDGRNNLNRACTTLGLDILF
jgi:hypothetical protein